MHLHDTVQDIEGRQEKNKEKDPVNQIYRLELTIVFFFKQLVLPKRNTY